MTNRQEHQIMMKIPSQLRKKEWYERLGEITVKTFVICYKCGKSYSATLFKDEANVYDSNKAFCPAHQNLTKV